MSAICATETFEARSQIDLNLPLQIAAFDASNGRIARLHGTPWEGPECAPKPPFRIEREIGFTVHSRSSRYRNDLQLAYRRGTDATPPGDRPAADGDVQVEEVAARRPQPNQSSLRVRAG